MLYFEFLKLSTFQMNKSGTKQQKMEQKQEWQNENVKCLHRFDPPPAHSGVPKISNVLKRFFSKLQVSSTFYQTW